MNTLPKLLQTLTSADETQAEQASIALIQMGQTAIPALLDLTHSPNTDARWWALRTLAQSPLSSTEWLVPFLLTDPVPEVRQCAALGLGTKADESAIQPLVRALSDKDSLVSSLSANALIQIGKASVPSLIEIVQIGKATARVHALRALAEIRDHRAIPVMMKVMEEDSALLQHWAQAGLERLGVDMVYMKPV